MQQLLLIFTSLSIKICPISLEFTFNFPTPFPRLQCFSINFSRGHQIGFEIKLTDNERLKVCSRQKWFLDKVVKNYIKSRKTSVENQKIKFCHQITIRKCNIGVICKKCNNIHNKINKFCHVRDKKYIIVIINDLSEFVD